MAHHDPSFATKPDDPSDVTAELTRASAAWKRGDRGDALKALRRAVEAASEAELDERALELAKTAADLATTIAAMPPAATRPVGPAAPRATVAGSSVPKPAPGAPRVPPSPQVQRQATEAPQTRTPAAPVPTRDVRETRKGERKSLTNEATRGRSSHAALDKATTAGAPQGRKKAASRTDRLESSRRASITDEIDAWPTEVIGGDLGLDRATTETGTTRLPLRTSQALRVKVWKDTEGVVRVSGGGPDVPKGAIDAHLVGLEPDDDLAALF